MGVFPGLILIDPKHDHNVGAAQRNASCFGFKQVWFTGNRVKLEPEKGKRLPREERMKGYAEVDVINYDYPFDQLPAGSVPVAIEVRENSIQLQDFEHPENAVYVFGPEDGSLKRPVLSHCHHFVVIPTRHCCNLAVALGIILWDRSLKHYQKVGKLPESMGLCEHRGMVGA